MMSHRTAPACTAAGDNAENRARVLLLMTDAGGGHRASAESLAAWVAKAGKPWEITVVNLYREILGSLEPFKRFAGFYGEDAYNFVLKRQWHACVPILHRTALAASHLRFQKASQAIHAYLRARKPAISISLMPFVNDQFLSVHASVGTRFGIVCTDLEDTRPAMWFTPTAMQGARFVCCGSEHAVEQARRAGADRRARCTGLVIHPRFFSERVRKLTQRDARLRLGLATDRFTVVVMTGGYGGAVIRDLVRRAEATAEGWQLVACCGHNDSLRRELAAETRVARNRVVPLGFTREVPELMRAADVLVTKPGPATIVEATTMGVPLVLYDGGVMPQERPNASWAEARGLAQRAADRGRVIDAVRSLERNPLLGRRMVAAQREQAQAPAGPRVIEVIEDCLASPLALALSRAREREGIAQPVFR
jgi:processive 1,2-diacylglycerol beta-glucosyltransferase